MKKKDGITVLKFIFGRAGSGKTTEVLNRIKNEVENGNSNLVLLVPEQTSFDYEKALLHILGDGRFTSVPVLSFTRLVDEVNRAAGGLGGTRIDDAKRTIADLRDYIEDLKNSAEEETADEPAAAEEENA